jgi:hypothetical protein
VNTKGVEDGTAAQLKSKMASLTAAEMCPAWSLLYELYGELPIPEKEGWKVAALLIRLSADGRGNS